MSPSNLVRLGGGLTSATAGVLLVAGHVLNLGGDPEYGTVLGASLVLTAHVALVFALVALYAAQAEQSGLPGSLGMVLGVAGTTLVSGSSWSRSPEPPGRKWMPCSPLSSRAHSLC
jgi:hypothetical protein